MPHLEADRVMPIRFRCQHCRQRLSVRSKKAGAVVLCPACKNKVVVPIPPKPGETPSGEPALAAQQPAEIGQAATAMVADEAAPDVIASEEDDSGIPFPEFTVYDYETEFIYETGDEDEGPRETVDFDLVAVPRWVLYAQGVLLGVVALLGFAFGVIMGSAAPRLKETAQQSGPLTISGEVAYNAGDNLPTPDSGAAVLLVPEDARPEQKAAVSSFLPGGALVDASDPAVLSLRQIGGDFTRADGRGEFRLVAPQPGPYFLLIISAHLDRPVSERAAPQDLAEPGRYVESAPELLAQKRYRWTRRRFDESEQVSHVFR
jgi:hypothetical protein